MSIDVAPYHALPHSSVPLFPAKPLMICSLLFKAGGKKKFRKPAHMEKKNRVTQTGLQIQVIFSDMFKWKKYGRTSKMRSIFPILLT